MKERIERGLLLNNQLVQFVEKYDSLDHSPIIFIESQSGLCVIDPAIEERCYEGHRRLCHNVYCKEYDHYLITDPVLKEFLMSKDATMVHNEEANVYFLVRKITDQPIWEDEIFNDFEVK